MSILTCGLWIYITVSPQFTNEFPLGRIGFLHKLDSFLCLPSVLYSVPVNVCNLNVSKSGSYMVFQVNLDKHIIRFISASIFKYPSPEQKFFNRQDTDCFAK